VHTIGGIDVLHPRSKANPLAYGTAKRVETAVGVATVSAAALFPTDQLETNAVAAASAPGFNAVGSAIVVVVVRADDDLVVDLRACVDCRPPV
jgi:hypothetical protein